MALSLQYSTMTVPGTGHKYYYNKLTHTGISYDNLSCMVTSGSGNFWPTVEQVDGETYIKIEVIDSNLSQGSTDKVATITVYGGSSSRSFTITQTTTEPYFRNAPSSLGTISWQGESVTIQLLTTRISSITGAVMRNSNNPNVTKDLQVTATPTSEGFDAVVTIPQSTSSSNATWNIEFIGESDTYSPPVSVNSRLNGYAVWSFTQGAVPAGSITFNNSILTYLNTPRSSSSAPFTTQYMDDSSIQVSVSGDVSLVRTPTVYVNDGVGNVSFEYYANSVETTKTLTLTLTGNDVGGVQRSDSITFTQVKASEGVYIRLVSVTYPDPPQYPWENATVTGTFYARNVSNLTFVPEVGSDIFTDVTATLISNERYSFTATLADNDSYTPRSGYYYLSGTNTIPDSPFGSTISENSNHSITQKGKPGVITINDPITLGAAATTYAKSYTTNGIQGNPTATLSGDVDATVTVNNNTIEFNTQYNDTWTELTGTLTLTGTDLNGDTITTTATVKQSPDVTLVISPSSQTLDYGENVATYTVTTNLSNIRLISVTGQTSFVSSYSLNQNVISVNTTDFDDLATKTATIRIAADTPIGTSYSVDATLSKNGPDGIITLDSNEKTITKNASSIEIGYTLDGINSDTIRVICYGGISFGTPSISASAITIPYNTNNTGRDLTGTITVYGTDYKGNTITETVAVTQLSYEPYLTITPSAKTVTKDQYVATYELNYAGISDLTVAISDDDSFVQKAYIEGGVLTVYLYEWTGIGAKTATLTVTGTGAVTLSESVTITKTGSDGVLTVEPEVINLPNDSTTFTIDISREGIPDISATASGNVNITSLSFNNDKTVLTVVCEPNTSSDTLTGAITISGADYKGKVITKTVTVNHTYYHFQITPKSQIVQYQQSTATITVDAVDVTFTNVSISAGTSQADRLVTGYTRNGNIITVDLKTATDPSEHIVYVTVSGVTDRGESVSEIATLKIWGPDGYIAKYKKFGNNTGVVECGGDWYWDSRDTGYYDPTTIFQYYGVTAHSLTLDADWVRITNRQSVNFPATYNSVIRLEWDKYSGPATNWNTCRVAHLTVTGIDYKGNTVTQTTVITQYASVPEISVNPKGQEIEWNGYAEYDVTIVGPTLPPDLEYRYNSIYAEQPVNYTWLGTWGDSMVRTNTVRVVPPANTSLEEVCSQLNFLSDSLISNCGQAIDYPSYAVYETVQFCQKPKPVIINLTPGSYTVNRNAGSVTFTITVDGVDQSTLQYSYSGSMITSAAFNADKTSLTVHYTNNPNVETRTAEICVSDRNNIVSGCATITQYGIDPEIDVDDLYIQYDEQLSTHFIRTKGVGNLSIQIDGSVDITDYTLTQATNGYNLIVETPNNLTFDILRSVCTVTGVVTAGQYIGNTITATFNIIKMAKDGVISISPSSQRIGKAGGSLTFDLTYGNINLATVSTNYGTFSADKSKLYVNVGANNTPADRTITVIVSGNDNNGNATSTSATIIQYNIDPYINVSDIGISNTQSLVQTFVGTKWIDNLQVSFSGDVVIDDYTLTQTVGGYSLTIVTQDNLGDNPLYSTATFTGDITTEPGETLTKTVQVIKYGREGTIYVDPAEFILKKDGGQIVANISYNNIDVSTVTTSLGTLSADKRTLTYEVAPNPNTTDRTITITISGDDVSSVTRSATITITQYGIDPYITITPSAQTVRYNDDTAIFTISSYKVSDLFVSFVGNLVIDSYSLENETLTIISENNEELMSVIEEITVTGTSDYLETVTATATLTKMGTGGGIIIEPSYTIAGNAGLLVVPYYADRVQEDTVYAFISGDIKVTNIAVNREGKFVLIEYNGNSGASSQVSTLTLTCYDEDGIPRTATSTITQLTNNYAFSINPTTRTIDYQASTVTNSVVRTSVDSISSFTYYGDMDATYSYDNVSTITISAAANEDARRKFGVVTLTGITFSGEIVTASGYILQNNEFWGDWGFEFLDSSQANTTVDGGGRKLYYDILSINRSTGEQVPYYVSGFVLTGYWGTLPSVRYSDGYPYIVIPINTREEERDVVATFMQEYSYLQLQAHIHQEEGTVPDVHPIWEIDEMTSPYGSFLEYHITNDGEIIYAGKAYKYPDEANLIWSVNDTVSNYLGNGIYFTDGIHQIPDYAKDFFIKTSADVKYVKTFYNSWAYKNTNYWLSDPIDNRVDPRQWLPVSFLSTHYPLINVGGRIYAALKENDGWTVMTNLKNYAVDCDYGITVSGFNNTSINYKIASGDYVLYYANAYGGWDSILLTGKVKKTDEIEHLNYKKRSNSQYKFSKINYQNNVTPTWSLNTGISIDGTKMYHLLESTMVYLHNLETNEIIPVVITNSQCEYLTRKNNGKRPYFYTITVEESNTKLRK